MNVQIFLNHQNHPTFHTEERLVNLVKRRECFVGLSIFLVYGVLYSVPVHYTAVANTRIWFKSPV